jgi:hypothetical protein
VLLSAEVVSLGMMMAGWREGSNKASKQSHVQKLTLSLKSDRREVRFTMASGEIPLTSCHGLTLCHGLMTSGGKFNGRILKLERPTSVLYASPIIIQAV